jgi:hypothetical protein
MPRERPIDSHIMNDSALSISGLDSVTLFYDGSLYFRVNVLTWICLTRGWYALHRSHRNL